MHPIDLERNSFLLHLEPRSIEMRGWEARVNEMQILRPCGAQDDALTWGSLRIMRLV